MLSDFWPHGEVATRFGIFCPEGNSERAIFIIDQAGVIQYIDVHDINDQPSNEVLFSELARINPILSPSSPIEVSKVEHPPTSEIVLYCNSWCPDCRKARQWLNDHQIYFIEVDVITNAHAARQVRGWANGQLVTPTFDVNGTIVVDWDEKRLAELLLMS